MTRLSPTGDLGGEGGSQGLVGTYLVSSLLSPSPFDGAGA